MGLICIALAFKIVHSNFADGQAEAILDALSALAMGAFFGAVYKWKRGTYLTEMNAYRNTRMCQRCGTFYLAGETESANHANFSDLKPVGLFAIALALLLLFISFPQSTQKTAEFAPIVKGSDYNHTHQKSKVASAAVDDGSRLLADDQSSDSRVGSQEASTVRPDSRAYSVALISSSPPSELGGALFSQGRIRQFGYASLTSRPFAIVSDEIEVDQTLMCAMMSEEGAEVLDFITWETLFRSRGTTWGLYLSTRCHPCLS